MIRIKVGASSDASLRDVFKPLIEAAKQSRKVVIAEATASAKGFAQETARGQKEAAKAASMAAREQERAYAAMFKDIERKEKDATKAQDRAQRDMTRSVEREAKARMVATEREYAAMIREEEKARRAQERSQNVQERARERSIQRGQRWALGGVADAGVKGARMALSFASRVAGGVARGAGVDLDLSSHVQRNVELERQAVDLSNAGFMPGAMGANGMRQNAADLIAQTRSIGTATGTSANDAMEGLQAFVGKTGDLKTGRDILKDMAVLSKATGANLNKMVDAAADVANNLGDVEDKGAVTTQLMKAFAGMGKEGAVEVKDLAKQMAGLAAVAPMFSGDRASTIAMMGALAQEARAKGGSKSAAQAVTSVTSFANTFSKSSRLSAFKSFGVTTQDSTGGLRSAEEIIVDSLMAASSKGKGGMASMSENMGKMFADVRARGAVRGFENTFREAGGGEAGARAVREEFEKLKNAAMGQGEVMDSFNAAMKTTESQATIFNNQLGDMASKLQAQVIPALTDLAPVILKLTQAGIDFVTWATGNSELQASKKAVATDLAGTNAMGQARISVADISNALSGSYVADAQGNQHFKAGTLTTQQVTAAQGADAALQAAIAQKEKEVAEFRKSPGYKNDEQIRAAVKSTDPNIGPEVKQAFNKYLQSTTDLGEMKSRETAIHTALENLNNNLMNGTLSVRIVDKPPPAIDPAGTTAGVVPAPKGK